MLNRSLLLIVLVLLLLVLCLHMHMMTIYYSSLTITKLSSSYIPIKIKAFKLGFAIFSLDCSVRNICL